jgi:hypothetical protein
MVGQQSVYVAESAAACPHHVLKNEEELIILTNDFF